MNSLKHSRKLWRRSQRRREIRTAASKSLTLSQIVPNHAMRWQPWRRSALNQHKTSRITQPRYAATAPASTSPMNAPETHCNAIIAPRITSLPIAFFWKSAMQRSNGAS